MSYKAEVIRKGAETRNGNSICTLRVEMGNVQTKLGNKQRTRTFCIAFPVDEAPNVGDVDEQFPLDEFEQVVRTHTNEESGEEFKVNWLH